MPRFLVLAAVLSVAWIGAAGAQPASKFLYFTSYSTVLPASLFETDASGKVLTTLAGLPGRAYPQGVYMAEDNRSYRVLLFTFAGTSYVGGLLAVSPQGQVTPVVAGHPLYRPQCMVLDSDGDWLVSDQSQSFQTQLLRVSGTSATVVATLPLTVYGMSLDVDSGQLVCRGQTRSAPYQYGYFRVDPVTGAVTGFAVSSTVTVYTYYGAHEMPFEGRSGAVIDMVYSTAARTSKLARIHPEIGMNTFPNAVAFGTVGDLVASHPATPPATGPAYFALARAGLTSTSPMIAQLKADGSLLTASTIQGPAAYYRSSLTRVGSRHLAWGMVKKPNDRVLNLDVPGSGGLPYLVGFSLRGVRPGPLLYDGREIPLVPDDLTLITMNGGVPGVLENTVGTLDATGRATVKVSVNALGSGLKGVKVWAAALVLDTKASAGVRAIVGPTLLVLK